MGVGHVLARYGEEEEAEPLCSLHPSFASLPHLALKWYFIMAAKTSLLGDPGATKPPSPIWKRVWVPPSELMGEICLSLLQVVVAVVRGLFSV